MDLFAAEGGVGTGSATVAVVGGREVEGRIEDAADGLVEQGDVTL